MNARVILLRSTLPLAFLSAVGGGGGGGGAVFVEYLLRKIIDATWTDGPTCLFGNCNALNLLAALLGKNDCATRGRATPNTLGLIMVVTFSTFSECDQDEGIGCRRKDNRIYVGDVETVKKTCMLQWQPFERWLAKETIVCVRLVSKNFTNFAATVHPSHVLASSISESTHHDSLTPKMCETIQSMHPLMLFICPYLVHAEQAYLEFSPCGLIG